MIRVIRRTCLSALVLAAMTVFAGCAAETGDPEESVAGQAGATSDEHTGEASNALMKVGNPPPPVGTVTTPTTTVPENINCAAHVDGLHCACDSDIHCSGIDDLCTLGGTTAKWNGAAWGCTIKV